MFQKDQNVFYLLLISLYFYLIILLNELKNGWWGKFTRFCIAKMLYFCVLTALIKNYSVISEFLIKHKHELRTGTNKFK